MRMSTPKGASLTPLCLYPYIASGASNASALSQHDVNSVLVAGAAVSVFVLVLAAVFIVVMVSYLVEVGIS